MKNYLIISNSTKKSQEFYTKFKKRNFRDLFKLSNGSEIELTIRKIYIRRTESYFEYQESQAKNNEVVKLTDIFGLKYVEVYLYR